MAHQSCISGAVNAIHSGHDLKMEQVSNMESLDDARGNGPELPPGSSITFNSGGDQLSIGNLNVRHDENSRAQGLMTEFPEIISPVLQPAPPLFIDFYPSGFGAMPHFPSIVCGMRVLTALKALSFAHERGMNAILSGQPLGIGEVASRIEPLGRGRRGHALILLGGYESFPALEEMIRAKLGEVFASVEILHLYGANEVDFAIMAGVREGRSIRYKTIQSDWRPDLSEGCAFVSTDGRKQQVEDLISETPEGFEIQQAVEKLSDRTRSFLDQKSPDWWRLHTGHVGFEAGAFIAQMRRGAGPLAPTSLTYGAFIDKFGMELQDKPRWSH